MFLNIVEVSMSFQVIEVIGLDRRQLGIQQSVLNCSRRTHITEYCSSCRIFLSWSNRSIFISRLRFLKNPFNSYGFSTLSTQNAFYIFNGLPNTSDTRFAYMDIGSTIRSIIDKLYLNIRSLATEITRPILVCYIDFMRQAKPSLKIALFLYFYCCSIAFPVNLSPLVF